MNIIKAWWSAEIKGKNKPSTPSHSQELPKDSFEPRPWPLVGMALTVVMTGVALFFYWATAGQPDIRTVAIIVLSGTILFLKFKIAYINE